VRRLDRSQVARLATALFLAVVLAGISGAPPNTAAKGDDVCPEPNDAFQQACFLGTASDALGFIGSADDVDAYRFDVNDFGAAIHLTLPDRPLPYRLSLASYDGQVIASTGTASLDATLPLPGTYYAFVDSATGEFDENTPYRIVATVDYPSESEPKVLYSHEFASNAPDSFSAEGVSGAKEFTDENGVYTLDGARVTLKLTKPGTADKPTTADFVLLPDPPDPGPTVDDFTLTIDTRLLEGDNAGYSVLFRLLDNGNYYRVDVKLATRQVQVGKSVDGVVIPLTEWKTVEAVRQTGVNRTVVRCAGQDLLVNINGKEIARVKDDTYSRGLVGYGAATWGGPAAVNFDNILVTTP
jgi:hypothetical protein